MAVTCRIQVVVQHRLDFNRDAADATVVDPGFAERMVAAVRDYVGFRRVVHAVMWLHGGSERKR